MNDKEFVEELKRKREEYGVTQRRFAVACGISRTYFNQIENGIAIPSAELKQTIEKQIERFNPQEPLVFYVCRNHRIYQVLLFLLAYIGATGNQPPLCTFLACLLILLYNGKRGKLKLKYFFYIFYPAHIFILYLIQIGMGKYLL